MRGQRNDYNVLLFTHKYNILYFIAILCDVCIGVGIIILVGFVRKITLLGDYRFCYALPSLSGVL